MFLMRFNAFSSKRQAYGLTFTLRECEIFSVNNVLEGLLW